MTTNRWMVLSLLMASSVSARAEKVYFSWWDGRFAVPGLYSAAAGGYSRDARLPDEPEIREAHNDSSTKTNRELARVLVVAPNSDVIGPDPYTAKAQTDFGQNHAQTQTFLTGFGETEDRQFFDRRSHSMIAESIWSDQWTFTGSGLGSAAVTLAVSFEVDISGSPCTTGFCGQVGNPLFTRQGLHAWWYRLYGSVRIFDLDVIDQLVRPDSDYTDDVPREVGAFEVFQQGSNIARDSFGPLEPYPDVANSRLTPIRKAGSASFVPVANHRYAVVGHIHVQSRDGADVDAGHTLAVKHVLLEPGLRLHSVASTNGANFRVLSATPLTASRTHVGEINLSFPTMTGVTYHVETQSGLGSVTWSLLATRTGNGAVQSATDSNPSGAARFYRLRIE